MRSESLPKIYENIIGMIKNSEDKRPIEEVSIILLVSIGIIPIIKPKIKLNENHITDNLSAVILFIDRIIISTISGGAFFLNPLIE